MSQVSSVTSDISEKIMALLAYSEEACTQQALCEFINEADNKISNVINQLFTGTLISFDNDHYTICNKNEVDKAKCYIRSYCNDEVDVFSVLQAVEQNNIFGMCELSQSYLARLCERKKYRAVKYFYDIMAHHFVSVRPKISDIFLCKKYVDTTYSLLTLFESFPFVLKKSLTWYLKARSLAFCIHYYTSEQFLAASSGFLIGNNAEEMVRYFYTDYIANRKFLIKNQRSNIEDIKLLPYLSIKYFMEGNFIKSINCVYGKFFKDAENNFTRHLFVFSACSAIYLGEYEICINILEKGHRIALSVGKENDARTLYAIMAYVYVFQNENEKALGIIDEILNDMDEQVLSYAELWAVRAKACLLYRTGDLAASFTCYRTYLERSVKNGMIHAGYVVASMVLELMSAWEIAGYGHPFEGGDIWRELEVAQKSPSCMLKLIALRCETELTAHKYGWDNEDAQRMLEECLRQARFLASPVQRAKTLICAARSAKYCGRKEEAQRHMLEVADTCRRYNTPVIPADMLDLMPCVEGKALHALGARQTHERNLPLGMESGFIVQSETMQELLGKVALLAPRNTSVLILGESGVGKEHIARQLHEQSGKKGAFVAVNLASIPDDLFESEFCGHEKGSFTGATGRKEGLLELADGGTLFLDEVGEIPPHMQVKLLRLLQEKQFMRVGGTKLIHSDFRVISATNRNLEEAVRNGFFREDLYYRINVFSLPVPPLRARQHDVIFIAEYFLDMFLKKYDLSVRRFSSDDLKFLTSYRWPGNVRELKNYIERYVFLSDSEHEKDHARLLQDLTMSAATSACEQAPEQSMASHNPDRGEAVELSASPPINPPVSETGAEVQNPFDLLLAQHEPWSKKGIPSLEAIKEQYIEFVYVVTNGTVSGPGGMADVLGVSKVTAYTWVDKLGLKERFRRTVVRRNTGNTQESAQR